MSQWKERWETNQIGWHSSDVNQNLKNHATVLFEKSTTPAIAVPLCGKSLDMAWLAKQNAKVTGIELVQKAIEDFFAEQSLCATQSKKEDTPCYHCDRIEILHSDIFELPKTLEGSFDAIYDRAAFVALPLELKQQYADLCLSLLKPDGSILLITYDAPIPETQGPPFPVKDGVIPRLYKNASQCILLEESVDTPDNDPRLKAQGLDWSRTQIWKITR